MATVGKPFFALSSLLTRAADNAAVPDTSKVCSAEEAVALIPDGVWLTPAGFVGSSCPELLLNALRWERGWRVCAMCVCRCHGAPLGLAGFVPAGDRVAVGACWCHKTILPFSKTCPCQHRSAGSGTRRRAARATWA